MFFGVVVLVLALIFGFIGLNMSGPPSTDTTTINDSSASTITFEGDNTTTSISNNSSISTITSPTNNSIINSTVLVPLIGILSSILVAFLGYNYTEDSKRSWNKTDDIWAYLKESTTTIVRDVKEMQLGLQQYAELNMLDSKKPMKNEDGIVLSNDKQERLKLSEEDMKRIVASHGEWMILSYPDLFKIDDTVSEKTTKDGTESEKNTEEAGISDKTIKTGTESTNTSKEGTESDKTIKTGTESIMTRKGETELAKNIRNIYIKKMDQADIENIRLGLMALLDAEYLRLYSEINKARTTLGVISIYSDEMNKTINDLMHNMKLSWANVRSNPNYLDLNSRDTSHPDETNEGQIRRMIIDLQDLCNREMEITRMGERDKYVQKNR